MNKHIVQRIAVVVVVVVELEGGVAGSIFHFLVPCTRLSPD
jgi:hypothetical protein